MPNGRLRQERKQLEGDALSKTLLLDADTLTYSVALSHQVAMPWTTELWTYKGDMSGAVLSVRNSIDRMLKATSCDAVRVALSDTESNFRRRIMPSYKSNRLSVQRPILFRALRELLRTEYGGVVIPGLEGDDLVAMWATERDADAVVCSIDKDIRGVPCVLFNPARGTTEEISWEEAERFFLSQVLTGDRVDGYPGCPGIGPKRAETLLLSRLCSEAWDVIVRAYEKAGLSEQVALENARCARLLRDGDLREDGAIRLWTPDEEEKQWLQPMAV